MSEHPLTFGVSRAHGAGGAPLLDAAARFAAALGKRLDRRVDVVLSEDYEHQLAAVARLYGAAAKGLRVVHVTDLIPPDGIALSAGAAADEYAVRAALLGLHETAAGALAVKALLQADRLVGVADSLRRMLRSWTELALTRAEGAPARAESSRCA